MMELPGSMAVAGHDIASAALRGYSWFRVRKDLSLVRGAHLALRTSRGLVRARSLRRFLGSLPSGRRHALATLKEEARQFAIAGLPRVLAEAPGELALTASRAWKTHLDEIDGAGRRWAEAGSQDDHDEWDRFFALPDPWAYDSDYEVVKYAQTLQPLAGGSPGKRVGTRLRGGTFHKRTGRGGWAG